MANKQTSKSKVTVLAKVLGSNWFFAFIIAFFLFQTIWIALSAIYPMLFDEEYHLGIIDIYSRQISPFIYAQPADAAFHGDITRYGSYLFHYLMSVPYGIIQNFTNDIQTTVILMRLICIGFVTAGLFVFRAFLLRAGLTKSMTHLSIAIFTMIPIVPLALSQVNYDSLAFLLIAIIFYLAIRSVEGGKNQITWIMLLLSTSALASLVKFTVLPVAFANVLFVAVVTWKKHKEKTLHIMRKQLRALPKATLILSILFLLFSIGMFSERYVVNLVKYRAIEPKCDQIHPKESCIQYAIWRRDTTWKKENEEIQKKRNNPLAYTYKSWIPDVYNDFTGVAAFTYDDPNQEIKIRYLPTAIKWSPGTIVMRVASWTMLAVSIIALIVTWKKLPNRKLRYLTMGTLLIFFVSMWLRNYSDYLYIGTVTATQGRYYIPLLIPILAVVGLAFRYLLPRMRQQAAFLVLCLVLLSQGGGAANYILYSSSLWYWPDNRQIIDTVNQTARQFLQLFTLR